MMSLKGKRALVTGGAVRIGRAIADLLAQKGATVCVQYNRSATEAQSWQDEVKAAGGEAHIFQADLSSESACTGLISDCLEAVGELDILVNNASVFNKHTLEQSDMAAMMSELWPNAFAPLQLMRAFAAQDRPGQIVNLLDRRITTHDTTCVPYLLSKKMLEELTKITALHWAPHIRVNAVAPGAVLPPPDQGAGYLKEFAGHVPLEIQVTPEDIAATVHYALVSEWMTGQTLFVDGGQHLSTEKKGIIYDGSNLYS